MSFSSKSITSSLRVPLLFEPAKPKVKMALPTVSIVKADVSSY